MIPIRLLTETITRLRPAPGGRDATGVWIEGAPTTTVLLAHVQPIGLEDLDEEGGVRLQERIVVWCRGVGVLEAAFDDRAADRVQIPPLEAGDPPREYVVERSKSWSGRPHTRAVLLRSG